MNQLTQIIEQATGLHIVVLTIGLIAFGIGQGAFWYWLGGRDAWHAGVKDGIEAERARAVNAAKKALMDS